MKEKINYGNIFKFLRDKDVIHRRTKINQIERQVRDKPYLYHFSVKEVQGILNSAGISVTESTVRRWIKISLLKAYKKSGRKYARWWVLPCHVRELRNRMMKMSEALEEYRMIQKREKKEHPRYVTEGRRDLPRDRQGRFISVSKEKTGTFYDHRHMLAKLG